jgi:hypothetical protein
MVAIAVAAAVEVAAAVAATAPAGAGSSTGLEPSFCFSTRAALFRFFNLCLCIFFPALAPSVNSRELAALGMCTRRPGHTMDGGRWLAGEVEGVRSTAHLENQLAQVDLTRILEFLMALCNYTLTNLFLPDGS